MTHLETNKDASEGQTPSDLESSAKLPNTEDSLLSDYQRLLHASLSKFGGRIASGATRLSQPRLRYYPISEVLREDYGDGGLWEVAPHLMRLNQNGAFACVVLAYFCKLQSNLWGKFFESFDTKNRVLTQDEVNTLLDDPRYGFEVKVLSEPPTVGSRNGSRVKPIPGMYLPLPGLFYDAGSFPFEKGEIFAFRTDPEEWARTATQDFVTPFDSHVMGAFCFLRYHSIGDAFVVTEIQSDVYGSLSSRGLKERYKHWAKALLLAFEKYAQSLPEEIRPKRIAIVDSNYQHNRWPNDLQGPPSLYEGHSIRFKGIADPLAKFIYEDVPLSLGYTKVDLGENAPETNRLGVKVPLGSGWVLEVGKSNLAPLVSDVFLIERRDFKDLKWMLSFPFKGWIWETLEAESPLKDPEFRNTLVRRSDVAEVLAWPIQPEYVPFSEDVHLMHQLTFINPPKHKAPIFRGNEKPAGDWDLLTDYVAGSDSQQLVFLPDRERHPQIAHWGMSGTRLQSTNFKGGGVRNPHAAADLVPKPESNLHIPIYRKLPEHQASTIHTQRFWGGLPLEEAIEEYRHMKNLEWIMWAIDPEIDSAVPKDPQVVKLLELPVWNGDEVELLSVKEYSEKYLGGSEQQFGVLRTCGPFDLRIAQAHNRIFSHTPEEETNIRLIEKKIQDVLRIIYAANGREFAVPDTSLRFTDDGYVGQREILAYLKAVSEANGDNPRKMLEAFEEKSLRTLGALHGFNGHLGGARCPHIGISGAIMGGASTPRNMDVTGTFHDLDIDVLVPPFMTQEIGGNVLEFTLMIPFLQHCDLFLWQESRYWLEILLFGRDLEAGRVLQEHPYGLVGSEVWRIEAGEAWEELEERRIVESITRQLIGFGNDTASQDYVPRFGPLMNNKLPSAEDLKSYTKQVIRDPRLREMYCDFHTRGQELHDLILEHDSLLDDLQQLVEENP